MERYIVIPATLTLTMMFLTYKLLWKKKPKHLNLPPSLPSLPIVGSMPFLAGVQRLHICFWEKTKQYGKVYSFYSGPIFTVVVNGYDALCEALVKRSSDLADRGELLYAEKYLWNPEGKGIIFKKYGEAFKKIRVHTLAIFKQFGFGDKCIMEERIQAEFQSFMKFASEQDNVKGWSVTEALQLATLNVIYRLIFNERFEHDDPAGHYLRQAVIELFDTYDPIYDIFPLITSFPHVKRKMRALDPVAQIEFFRKKIRESQIGKDSGDNFVKEYVDKMGSSYDELELVYILRDFILAGQETTATQINFGLMYMINHPEIQARLQKDIDAVVPRDRLPSLDDKAKLPYLDAFIFEVMRIKTSACLPVPRMTLRETELCGYTIPAKTKVMMNLWSAHMDPESWPEPEEFRPERFLDENENVINQDRIINFSLGKRACPGELLARQELFLFLSGLIQQFDVKPPVGQTKMNMDTIVNLVQIPLYHELRLVARA